MCSLRLMCSPRHIMALYAMKALRIRVVWYERREDAYQDARNTRSLDGNLATTTDDNQQERRMIRVLNT